MRRAILIIMYISFLTACSLVDVIIEGALERSSDSIVKNGGSFCLPLRGLCSSGGYREWKKTYGETECSCEKSKQIY